MVRKLVLFLVILSVLASGCLVGEPPGQGTLQFQSSPAGAQVYLDNVYRGTTPTTVTAISAGNHTLEYRATGYRNWQSEITVSSGTSTFFAALLPSAAVPDQEIAEITTPATEAPVPLTVIAPRDPMIVGTSQLFSGTSAPGQNVVLTLYGPGKYATGVDLIQASVGADGRYAFNWNPGTSILSGPYTIIATNVGKTASARAEFTVIGGGAVTVATDKYTVTPGSTITFSGKCTTGSQRVGLTLSGPGQFTGGISLGTQPINADKTWSYPFQTSLSMPIGAYTIYVNDEQRTASASTGFTILSP